MIEMNNFLWASRGTDDDIIMMLIYENLKSSPSSQFRMVAPPATWIVAKVQVYPVTVEVVGSLNDIVFPERICIMLETSQELRNCPI